MKKLSTLLLTLILGLSLLSCNDSTSKILEETLIVNPSNPANPYDMVGEMHNAALGKTMEYVWSSPVTLSAQDIISISRECSFKQISNYPSTRSVTLDELEVMTEEEIIALLEDMDNNLENFIAELNLSPHAKVLLKDLVTSILSMADEDDLNYDMLHEKVITFENRLLLEKQFELGEIDELALLSGTSTLRYSLAYWEDIYGNNEVGTRATRNWWQWLVIGIVDAAGAVNGAIGGAVGGITLGGGVPGGVVGAIAGGITVGVGASSGVTSWMETW